MRCSFCNKTQDEVRKLIAGPKVYICEECVDRCIDVTVESEARAILVWRGDEQRVPAEARRPEIDIVKSFGACLDRLTAVPQRHRENASFMARVKRMLGLSEADA